MNAPLSTEQRDLPAFPTGDFRNVNPVPGMTMRELFAAMAMQGMMAAETAADDFVASGVAKRAVIYADALLAELAKVTS